MKAEEYLRQFTKDDDPLQSWRVQILYRNGLPVTDANSCVTLADVVEEYAKEYYQSKCCHKVIEPNGLVYRFNNVCEKCGKILNQ